MKQFISISIFALAIGVGSTAGAASFSIKISDVKVEQATNKTLSKSILNQKIAGFSKITVEGFETDKTVGAPELPVKSILLQGRPEQISVTLNVKKQKVLNVKPIPVQEEDCRCATSKIRKFQYNANLYNSEKPYTLTYLGAFRGTAITRLDINMATYDSSKSQTVINTEMEGQFNVPEYSLEAGDYRDYLIVTTSTLKSGVSEFAAWKKSQGYNVTIEEVSSPTVASIKELVKKYYAQGVDFVILLGDANTIPMDSVNTESSAQTPSDLPYYTMDGADDHIPDMFYGRIVTGEAAQVAAQLNKSLEFEQKSTQDLSGFKKIIGIASNQGSGPSDNEYVTAIESNFKSVLGAETTHFFENDSTSNPTELNKALNQGAFWLTYVGHGSGTSWPSLGTEYSISDMKDINNRNVVKPIVIDVACMNGVNETGYFGSSLMHIEGDQFGAAAYYGGTVNVSWHPPAIMATGIASEQLAKKFKHLGEALLAGQLYLAAKWNNKDEIVDNMEWYHLQGDPGMNIQF